MYLDRSLKYCNFINGAAYFISRYVPWIKSTVDYLEIDHTPRESDRSRMEHAKVGIFYIPNRKLRTSYDRINHMYFQYLKSLRNF